jgi:hypothetical protein
MDIFSSIENNTRIININENEFMFKNENVYTFLYEPSYDNLIIIIKYDNRHYFLQLFQRLRFSNSDIKLFLTLKELFILFKSYINQRLSIDKNEIKDTFISLQYQPERVFVEEYIDLDVSIKLNLGYKEIILLQNLVLLRCDDNTLLRFHKYQIYDLDEEILYMRKMLNEFKDQQLTHNHAIVPVTSIISDINLRLTILEHNFKTM